MKSPDQIPYYAPDGRSLGFRTIEAASRLVSGGHVKPAYGRKGHLKAIWSLQEGGGNPVESHPRGGTRYVFLQPLDSGHRCWKHRKVEWRDDDAFPVSTRGNRSTSEDVFGYLPCEGVQKERNILQVRHSVSTISQQKRSAT